MQRLRELTARGGIAVLAIVFALALTVFNLTLALSTEIVSVVQQQTADSDEGWTFDFTVGETTISYAEVLYYGVAFVLLALALYLAWLLTRSASQTCPECLSPIPHEASVCRYCTTDLAPAPDA